MFAAGMIALVSEYPFQIVENLLSPISGIPAKHKFLPSIAEMRVECEKFAQPLREREWEDFKRATPPKFIAPPDAPRHIERPTLDELRAKHGENWGIEGAEPARKSKWMDLGQLAKAYGVDPKVAQALPDAPQRRA